MAPEVGLEPTTLRLTAACSTIELLWNWKWLPRKDSHLHKNVNSVPCYFDTTREFKKMFTGFQRTFHLLIITSSDYNTQCLSVSIHYLLLQLVIQIRTECLPHMGRLFYQLNYVRCLHLMYLKKWHPLKESNFPSRIWSPTRLTLEH